MLFTYIFVVLVSSVTSFNVNTYSTTKPSGDHTTAGKYFDQQGDIARSIEAFRAAALYNSEPKHWNNLGLALISMKRSVPREQALAEGLDAFERALWYDRDNTQGWANFESVNKELKNYEWSGQSGRKRFLKNALSAPPQHFPKQLKSTIKLKKEIDFWNFLSSDTFQLKYFEKWPVLLRGSKRMFGDKYYSIEQMLSSWVKIGNGGYTPPYRNLNLLRGSLAKKASVSNLPTWFSSGTGMKDALRRGYNLQLLHAESWEKSVARYVAMIQNRTKTISSTNVYVTPPQRTLSTPAHTDFTGNMMVQIHGRKRWKLWKKPAIWLPANKKYIIGRDEFELLKDEELGEPLMDVVLYPGDALYVPRGCFHRTATPNMDGSTTTISAGDDTNNGIRGEQEIDQQKKRDMLSNKEILEQTSVHLTTHMAKLHDFGGLEQIMTTAMGANKNALFENRWNDAIDNLLTKDIRYRHGLHFRKGWQQKWKKLMHGVVDEMLDNTKYLENMKRNFNDARIRRTRKMFQIHQWNDWNGDESVIPDIEPAPDMNIDPVFMPLAKEVESWSIGSSKFHDKCSTEQVGSIRIKMNYFNRLYNTTKKKGQEEEEEEDPDDWEDENEFEDDDNDNSVVPVPAPKSPKGMFSECVYESKEGMCASLQEEYQSGEIVKDRPSHAIIMLQYKRGKILKKVLGDISKQTTFSDVYIWNNNVNNKIRCKMMSIARKIANENGQSGIRTLWIHNSPVNIGPPGSYVMANTISKLYKQFIFVDDDCKSPSNMIETFIQEQKQYPKDMISTWALKFLNLANYWDRTGSNTHEVVSYAGSAQFTIPSLIFHNLHQFLDYYPRRYLCVTDIWLNSYVTDQYNGSLRRSSLPEHSSLGASMKKKRPNEKSVALSEYTGMRALKTEFMQYIVTTRSGSMLEKYFERRAK